MSYSFVNVGDERIIAVEYGEDFRAGQEMPRVLDDLRERVESTDTMLVHIGDARNIRMNFSDLVQSMGLLTAPETGILRHERLVGIIVVTNSALYSTMASALGQRQYGGKNASVVQTMEDALDAAQRILDQG